MDIRKLQRAIVDGLEDVKAQDIVVFNTEHLSPLFERVIVASGTSNRQTKALASSVREAVKAKGGEILSVEGEDNGEWIIVDCGAAVAHIMQPAIRQYYHLEEIWGGKAVRIKLGAAKGGLVKASEPESAEEDEIPAGKAAVAGKPRAPKRGASRAEASEKPVARKAPAKKAAAKPAAAAPVKSPARKTPAGKPAARKNTARKTSANRAAEAKLPVVVVGAPAARKTAAAKAPARKTTPRSSAVRVAPAAEKTSAARPAAKAAPRKTAGRKAG
jgi:ribosome-associated protein